MAQPDISFSDETGKEPKQQQRPIKPIKGSPVDKVWGRAITPSSLSLLKIDNASPDFLSATKADFSPLEPANSMKKKGKGLDFVSVSPSRKDRSSLEPETEILLEERLDCMAYCSLFPNAYEIQGEELLQLWMAAGLIQQEPMEVVAAAHLETVLDRGGGLISLTREDCGSGEKWYEFDVTEGGLDGSGINIVRVDYSDDPIRALRISKTEDPFHASFGVLPSNLDFVARFTLIRTLLLLRGHASSHIDYIPYEFFMSLKYIQILDLSGTRLTELPSSVGGAKFLRYLNLSETLIQRLPETIGCLSNLQTLKLRNCSRLVALPKAMRRLTSLQYLDLGSPCVLRSMPPGMGALTRLYTLSTFIVGGECGCCVGELKNLNNLRGRVRLSRLENVRSVDEAKEAQLHNKQSITKLELRWTDRVEWDCAEGDGPEEEEEVIQHLQPPIKLQDLEILGFRGSKLPTWISTPLFVMLARITLFKCENCQLLPSLGQLPSLECLSLIQLVQVKIIDLNFCVDTATPCQHNFVAFPKLQRLEIKCMLSLEEWRDMEKVRYFPCLTELEIKDCPQLATLCKLSNIHCLKFLEISRCGNLSSLPKGGLPSSVKTFVVDGCPLLYLSCSSLLDEKLGWHKTEHTSSLLIYANAMGN